jgi:hypothetical protein
VAVSDLEILRQGLGEVHRMLDTAIEDMTSDQLNYRPESGGISAFFSLWHYVRTEDNIVNFVIQRQPTVWLEGGYDERFGLHRTGQGTGMTDEEAQAVRIDDLDGWREYQSAVWQATERYLEGFDEASLASARVTIKPVGAMSLWQGLWGMCLTHGFRHVGEIEHARGLVGLGGLTI